MKIHSYLNPKCIIADVPGKGRGIVATEKIGESELVMIWGGVIYDREEIESLSEEHPHFWDNPVSVCDGFWIGPSDVEQLDPVEYINHSCDPNAGVKGQIVLLSRRDIHPGEDVTFDYDTTEVHSRPFRCHCGASHCRGTIDGTAWQDLRFQGMHAGWFSWWIEDKIRRLLEDNTSDHNCRADREGSTL